MSNANKSATWKLIPGNGRIEIAVYWLLNQREDRRVYIETQGGEIIVVRAREENDEVRIILELVQQ